MEEHTFPDGRTEVRRMKDDGKGNRTDDHYRLQNGERLPIEDKYWWSLTNSTYLTYLTDLIKYNKWKSFIIIIIKQITYLAHENYLVIRCLMVVGMAYYCILVSNLYRDVIRIMSAGIFLNELLLFNFNTFSFFKLLIDYGSYITQWLYSKKNIFNYFKFPIEAGKLNNYVFDEIVSYYKAEREPKFYGN